MLHFNISCNSATPVMSLALILRVKFLLSTCKNVDWILRHSFQNYVWKLQPHFNATKGENKNQMRPWGFTEVTEHMQPNASRIISTVKEADLNLSPNAWCFCGGNHRVIVHACPRRKTFPRFKQHRSSRRGPLLLGFILGARCSQFHSASRWENNDPTGMTSWF